MCGGKGESFAAYIQWIYSPYEPALSLLRPVHEQSLCKMSTHVMFNEQRANKGWAERWEKRLTLQQQLRGGAKTRENRWLISGLWLVRQTHKILTKKSLLIVQESHQQVESGCRHSLFPHRKKTAIETCKYICFTSNDICFSSSEVTIVMFALTNRYSITVSESEIL